MLRALLLVCAALRGAQAQVYVGTDKPQGTYDPCKPPPTGVRSVRSRGALADPRRAAPRALAPLYSPRSASDCREIPLSSAWPSGPAAQ